MTLGIQTQIAIAREREIRALTKILGRRLNLIEVMLGQFTEQCQAVPEGDQARVVVETMINSLLQVVQGKADLPTTPDIHIHTPGIILPS